MEAFGRFAWILLALGGVALAASGDGPTLSDLGLRLARDSTVLDAPHVRPVHRGEPIPSSLGDALASHLPAFESEYRQQTDPTAALGRWKAVASGRPTGKPDAADKAAVARLTTHLDAILAATRATRADLAPAHDPFMPADGATWAGYQLAMAMAGARSRWAFSRGDVHGALQDCLDALGLARDAAISGGLIGSMVAAAGAPSLVRVCAEAIDAGPVGEKQEALRAVRTIRAALPSLVSVFRIEALQMELMLFGRADGPDLFKTAGPRTRAWIDADGASPPPKDGRERERRRKIWARARAAWDELLAAATLGPPERARALERVRRMLVEATGSKTGGADSASPAYERYAVRIEVTHVWLDALALSAAAGIARAESGAWPKTPAALAALLPPEAEERPAAMTSMVAAMPDDSGIVLHVPLPAGADEHEVALTLRARR